MLRKVDDRSKTGKNLIPSFQQQVITHNKNMLAETNILNVLFPPYRSRTHSFVSDTNGNRVFHIMLIVNNKTGKIDKIDTKYIQISSNQSHLPITVALQKIGNKLVKINFLKKEDFPEDLKNFYNVIVNI